MAAGAEGSLAEPMRLGEACVLAPGGKGHGIEAPAWPCSMHGAFSADDPSLVSADLLRGGRYSDIGGSNASESSEVEVPKALFMRWAAPQLLALGTREGCDVALRLGLERTCRRSMELQSSDRRSTSEIQGRVCTLGTARAESRRCESGVVSCMCHGEGRRWPGMVGLARSLQPSSVMISTLLRTLTAGFVAGRGDGKQRGSAEDLPHCKALCDRVRTGSSTWGSRLDLGIGHGLVLGLLFVTMPWQPSLHRIGASASAGEFSVSIPAAA
mmetsp:Transcript_14637/g.32063  ORF Transcript_14637/g.32063 Transcript_14637/m.32063 type:complete len:270 (+) Transcript_14637:1114-1923(+)